MEPFCLIACYHHRQFDVIHQALTFLSCHTRSECGASAPPTVARRRGSVGDHATYDTLPSTGSIISSPSPPFLRMATPHPDCRLGLAESVPSAFRASSLAPSPVNSKWR